ncbi:hypothetical protein [Azospirillum sp. SYSU D00513]|uniref:hypothetical protein n=1 Tax=Azospirillum sp. SYSU D00513 TaxID=2812561 RepID=UPI001A973EF5|nr:hypothetical protein [Azospirillum sp. SYSU D00513]
MLKTVKLSLNAFPGIPKSLRDPVKGDAASKIPVNLADLYHQYYLDSWGVRPPIPDPAHFEHVRYLLPCSDFRFSKQGLGIAKTFKGNKSNELGQAFCRWFLSEHLDIHYIAHLESVRDHGALTDYGGVSVHTKENGEGDAPDYFCVSRDNNIYLAEAKGTRHAVGFKTKEFQAWRDQFNRVTVNDSQGEPAKVKGYIVAMRWAMETDSAKISTTLLAEDPETLGERPLGSDSLGLVFATKSIHYASSLQRLRQPLMAQALLRGFTIPEELQFQLVVWKCLLPPLDKLQFVGGYFPDSPGLPPIKLTPEGQVIFHPADPFRLDIGSGTFFGIEKRTFKILAEATRTGPHAVAQLEPLEGSRFAESSLSLLRDGHILGPVDFFRPVEVITV